MGMIQISDTLREAILNGTHDALMLDADNGQLFVRANRMVLSYDHKLHALYFQFFWDDQQVFEVHHNSQILEGEFVHMVGIEYQVAITLNE